MSSAPDMGPAIQAQKQQSEFEQSYLNKIYADEAPFRALQLERGQFGASMFPSLAEDIKNPTLSPGFQKVANTGLDILRSKYSAAGSPSSGPSQVAGANFFTDLGSGELNRFNENRMRLAGFQGQPQPSQAPGILNTMQSGTNNLTDLLTTQASTQNQGGFPWGSLFGLGLGGLSGGLLQGGGTWSGGQAQGTAGGSIFNWG